MASLTPISFVDILRGTQMLDQSQLDEIARMPVDSKTDPSALAQSLVDRGWLTRYQADQVLEGKVENLTLGAYRLLEPLGEGGMGQVYKAQHTRLNRVVALKVIRPQVLAAHQEAVRRFQREAQAVAQLSHPNVVVLYDADEINGTHFIAMEYVEGVDLARMVKKNGPLPVPIACEYVRQAALGLQHAYEMGLVHRDIKPSNLLLANAGAAGSRSSAIQRSATNRNAAPTQLPQGGTVKILDMGLARLGSAPDEQSLSLLTQEGAVMGTPDFIAPEQARNAHNVDIRSDLYSLGCTFYFLLTGRPPFPSGTSVEKLLMHQLDMPTSVEVLRPQTPPDVAAIVRKLMAKRPENRYQAPVEVAHSLAAIIDPASAPWGRAPVEKPAAQPGDVIHVTASNSTLSSSPGAYQTIIVPARKKAVLQGHSSCVMALAFSPDGRLLASGSLDDTVRLWEVGGVVPRESGGLFGRLGEVHALAFAPGRTALVTGSAMLDGFMWRWDWTLTNERSRVVFGGDSATVDALAFAPDGRLLASSGANAVYLWNVGDADMRKRAVLKGHLGAVKVIAFAPDSRRLASSGTDGTVRLWEVGRFWCRQRLVLLGHDGAVGALAYSPDGKLLASGGLDRAIRVWDAHGGSSDERAVLLGSSSAVRLLQFLPDGHTLMSVAEGGQVSQWDISSRSKLREWVVDKTMVFSMALSPDVTHFATGATDGSIILYSLARPGGEEEKTVLMRSK